MASTTSYKFAVDFYNSVSKHLFDEVEKINQSIDVFIFHSIVDDINKVKSWVGKDFIFCVQEGNDLGEKMSNAFEQVFSRNYSSAIIIGSDVPEISQKILLNAYNSLEQNNIVISPSDDGGYSLFGMNEHHSDLFKEIEWSTNSVFNDTLQKVLAKKLTLKILPNLNDIDNEIELRSWMKTSNNFQLINELHDLARKENIRL